MAQSPAVSGAPVPSPDPETIEVGFDEPTLLDDAAAVAGSSDPGNDSFHEPLKVVTDALQSEAELTSAGRMAVRSSLVGMLARRMTLTADARHEPAILDERIERPIIVTGLPRTGTTLLHGLLAADPASRAPLQWEVDMPSPPPNAATWHDDPRVGKSRAIYDQLNALRPTLARAHPMGAELPAECINIFDISLRTLSFPAIYHVPSYVTWLLAADATPVYSTHRRVLQQLQCRGPKGRWVLKAPAYMAAGHGLWDAYPEACVVQLHRDPAEVFPSLASLLSLFRSLYTDDLRRVTLGAEMIDVWGRSLDHFLAVRDQRPEGREVLDMTYVDLLDDPRKAVARIYERFGLELSPSADERMAAYLASHGQAAHGRHEYTPEQFGLNAGAVRERFASYIDRFAIPVTAA